MTDIHQHLHGGARNLPADRHACGKYLKYAILKAARNDTKCDRPVRQCQFGGLQLLLRRRQPRHRFLPVSPPGVPASGDTTHPGRGLGSRSDLLKPGFLGGAQARKNGGPGGLIVVDRQRPNRDFHSARYERPPAWNPGGKPPMRRTPADPPPPTETGQEARTGESRRKRRRL
jgi:hypothetical protein